MAEIALAIPGLIDVISRGGLRIAMIVESCIDYENTMAEYKSIGLYIGQGMFFFYLETVKRAWQDPSIPKTVNDEIDTNVKRFHDQLELTISDLRASRAPGSKNRIGFALRGKQKLERRFEGLKKESDALYKLGINLCVCSIKVHSSILTIENFALIHETKEHNPAQYLPTSNILIAKGNYNLRLGKKS